MEVGDQRVGCWWRDGVMRFNNDGHFHEFMIQRYHFQFEKGERLHAASARKQRGAADSS